MLSIIRREHVVVCGAVVGLAIAIVGAMESARSGDDSVARVNGVPIPHGSLDLAVVRFGATSREERAAALRFLVDEELLIQRAEKVGLIEHDRTIKKAMIRAVIDRVNDTARKLGRDSNEFAVFWEQQGRRFLRDSSEEQARELAEREFRIRFPDTVLRNLLANLRTRADIDVPDAAGAHREIAVRVNGVDIPVDLVGRFLDALMEPRRERPSQRDLKYALDRVVDEELLFQYALETGVHRSERDVRTVISKIMLDTIAMESVARPATGAAVVPVEAQVARLRANARIEWPDWMADLRPDEDSPT